MSVRRSLCYSDDDEDNKENKTLNRRQPLRAKPNKNWIFQLNNES